MRKLIFFIFLLNATMQNYADSELIFNTTKKQKYVERTCITLGIAGIALVVYSICMQGKMTSEAVNLFNQLQSYWNKTRSH